MIHKKRQYGFIGYITLLGENMKTPIILIFVVLLGLFGCDISSTLKLGNTNGNISNYGYRVKTSDGIVFANSRDHLSIYHSNNNGTEIEKISSTSGVYLNAHENWVYFMSLDDEHNIVKLNSDGSSESIISHNSVSPYGGMMIIDGWIYYVNADDNNHIYKMSLDGSIDDVYIDEPAMRINASDQGLVFILMKDSGNELVLSDYETKDMKVLASHANDLTLVIDQWVYFNKSSDQGKLYRVKVDGSDEMKVNDLRVYGLNENKGRLYFSDLNQNYRLSSSKLDGSDIKVINNDMVSDLLFVDGWLYYLNHSDSGREYRIKGNDKEKVISVPKATPLSSSETESMMVGSTNSNRLSGGYFTKHLNYLIFVGQSETMNGMYRIDLTNPEAAPIQISIDHARNLNTWKDWIYFINESDYSGIYRMKADGSDIQIVLDQSVGNLIIYGNWMYFLNHLDNQRIYKAKVDGTQLTKLSETSGIFSFCMEGEWLVYADGQGQAMIKMKLDGSDEQVLSSYASTYLITHDQWVYYGDDNSRIALSKVKLDGSSNTYMINDLASHVHIHHDYIFYYDGMKEAIMRMDINGENIIKISDKGDFGWFHIIDDRLYYYNNSLFVWFVMDLDGSNNQRIQ
jgi:hypothetical protein